MSNSDYMTPKPRGNKFLRNDQLSSFIPIHIFTLQTFQSPQIMALDKQCERRNILTIMHGSCSQLLGLGRKGVQRIFVVIDTLAKSVRQQALVFPQKFQFPIQRQNLKIVAIPNRIPGVNYDVMRSEKDIISAYLKFINLMPSSPNPQRSSSKIKLRNIHSLKDIKYQLVSPQKLSSITLTKNPNKQVYFLKLLYNSFKVEEDSQFKLLTDSIKSISNTLEVHSFAQLRVIVDGLNSNKGKVLLLVDEKMLKEYRYFLQRNKLAQRVQLIVFGQLKPSRQLLNRNVYFACDNVQGILYQLQKMKFQQVQKCRSEYIRLSTQKRNRFMFSQLSVRTLVGDGRQQGQGNRNNKNNNKYNNNDQPYVYAQNQPSISNHITITVNELTPKKTPQKPQLHRLSQKSAASIYSNASSHFDRYMRNWLVDVDQRSDNRATAQYSTKEESKQHIDGPSQPVSKRVSRITAIRRNSSESSESNFLHKSRNLISEVKLKQEQNLVSSQLYQGNQLMPPNIQYTKLHKSQEKMQNEQLIQNSNISLVSRSSLIQPRKILIVPKTKSKVTTTTTKKTSSSSQQNSHQSNPSQKQQPKPQPKYQQIPQNTIQQTSEQHRGSNRQSIMYIDENHNSNHSRDVMHNGLDGKLVNEVMTGNNNSKENRFKSRVVNVGFQLVGDKRVKQGQQMRQGNESLNDRQKDSSLLITPKPSEVQLKCYKQSEFLGSPYVIDGKSGELLADSQKRMKEIYSDRLAFNSSQHIQSLSSSPYHHNPTIRKSGHIEPSVSVAKISAFSSSNLGYHNLSSKKSNETEKKISTASNHLIQSLTSLNQKSRRNNNINLSNNMVEFSPRDLGYHNASESISSKNIEIDQKTVKQKLQSPSSSTTQYTTMVTPLSTSNNNHHANSTISNYKIFKPQKQQSKDNLTNKVHTQTLSPVKEFKTLNQQGYNNQYSLTKNHPEIINRVNIKENDLPLRATDTIVNNYQLKSAPMHSFKHYQNSQPLISRGNNDVHQFQHMIDVKQDPFEENQEKNSLYKQSCTLSKQDGNKDPQFLYEKSLIDKKNSQQFNKNEIIQKVNQKKNFLSPGSNIMKTTNESDFIKYQCLIQNDITVYRQKSIKTPENKLEHKKVSQKQLAPRTYELPILIKDNNQSSNVSGQQFRGATRYQHSGRNYANSPTIKSGTSYQKGLITYNPQRRQKKNIQQFKSVLPLFNQKAKPWINSLRQPRKLSSYRSLQTPKQNVYTSSSPIHRFYLHKEDKQPVVKRPNIYTKIQPHKKLVKLQKDLGQQKKKLQIQVQLSLILHYGHEDKQINNLILCIFGSNKQTSYRVSNNERTQKLFKYQIGQLRDEMTLSLRQAKIRRQIQKINIIKHQLSF